ncbi:hypothetical protein [Nocardia thailandica]
MTIVELPGSIDSALTHFALYGAAAIWEDDSASIRLRWTESRSPRAQLISSSGTAEGLAQAVHRHASAHAAPDSWVQQSHHHEGRDTATFSPRIKVATTTAGWLELQRRRHVAMDTLAPTAALDHRMIGGLGEPASWREESSSPRPDEGASRWEMKTRNRGEEFVGQRLAPLADVVAARTVEQVHSGLTGSTVADEVGNNQVGSRTATGLAKPGPVDNAIAWCALWGISQFPVIQHIDRQSTTPAAQVPPRRAHPVAMHLPVTVEPITLARLRSLLLTKFLLQAHDPSRDEFPAAATWLRNRRVVAIASFPIHVTDNPSAPERQVLAGSLTPLPKPATLGGITG